MKISGMCRVRSLPADQLSQLEPVHLRHLHVQQGQRHIVVGQQQFQGLGPRLCLEDFQPVTLQQRFQSDQVFRNVIDEQAFDAVGLAWAFQR
jgi:hypothetical protein